MHFHYSKNLISHTHQTTPPVRRRRMYGVSRQTRMHTSIIQSSSWLSIFHNNIMLHVLVTPSYFYNGIVRIPLFGCCPRHRTYCCWRNFEWKHAHGLSRNEFTSPFYFMSIFTIRILFAIFPEVRTYFSNKQKCKRKKDEEQHVYQYFISEQSTFSKEGSRPNIWPCLVFS